MKNLLGLLILLCACTGPTGPAGASCSVNTVANGAIIKCTDGTNSVILNGLNAPPTAYTVTAIKDPCGKQTSFDEVLLILEDHQILAHYASGSNQFLTLIGPGNYVTTDGSSCYFTVDVNGNIINEHN